MAYKQSSSDAELDAVIKIYADKKKLTEDGARAELVAKLIRNGNDNGNGDISQPRVPNIGEYKSPNTDFLDKLTELSKLNRAKTDMTGEEKMRAKMDVWKDFYMEMEMMKSMMPGHTSNGNQQEQKQQDIEIKIQAALDKQAQMFREEIRRITDEQKEKDRKLEFERAIQNLTHNFESKLGDKGDSANKVMAAKIEELTATMNQEKDRRHSEAIAANMKQIEELRKETFKYIQATQQKPKSFEDGIDEYTHKFDSITAFIKKYGKGLGMSDKEVDAEVSSSTPLIQQLLGGLMDIANAYVKRMPGMQNVTPQEPGMDSPQPYAPGTVQCGSCGQASMNGTSICDACRQPTVQDAPGRENAGAPIAEHILPGVSLPEDEQNPQPSL